MKRLTATGILALITVLFLSLPSLAREEGEKPPRRRPGREEGFEPHRPPWEDVKFKEFREQIGQLGRQIRKNRARIEELEMELSVVAPAERDAIQSRLDDALRERAILKYTLTRHRVELTRRVLEIAKSRHEEAAAELERIIAKIQRDYPDLDLSALPEPPPPPE